MLFRKFDTHLRLCCRWKVWKDSVKVIVAEGNTELSPKSLIIQGYDVTGSVKDEGEPIKDTTIALFARTPVNIQYNS